MEQPRTPKAMLEPGHAGCTLAFYDDCKCEHQYARTMGDPDAEEDVSPLHTAADRVRSDERTISAHVDRLPSSVAEAQLVLQAAHPRTRMNEAQEWTVERYPGFAFHGPKGGQALADLLIMRHQDEPAVVVATERDDNPGVSVTNGAEQLAAAVLTQHFPGYVAGLTPPFTLFEHNPKSGTFQEVAFTDYNLQPDRAVPRIGEVREWRTAVLQRTEEETLEQSQAPRRGLHR